MLPYLLLLTTTHTQTTTWQTPTGRQQLVIESGPTNDSPIQAKIYALTTAGRKLLSQRILGKTTNSYEIKAVRVTGEPNPQLVVNRTSNHTLIDIYRIEKATLRHTLQLSTKFDKFVRYRWSHGRLSEIDLTKYPVANEEDHLAHQGKKPGYLWTERLTYRYDQSHAKWTTATPTRTWTRTPP